MHLFINAHNLIATINRLNHTGRHVGHGGHLTH